MRLDLAAWMTSLLLCASVSYFAFDGEHNFLQIALGFGVCIALLHEHGFKLYLKNRRFMVYTFFYALPTTIALVCILLNADTFL